MMKKSIIDYGVVVFAGLLYAIALKYFVLPSKVILTGTEGIAAALSYYFDHYALFIILYLVFQSVLLVFAYLKISKMFALRSFLVVAVVVVALAVLPQLNFAQPEPQNERLILVIFGGLLAGVAKAIAFKRRGSTGDEDILGAYFAMKYLKPVGSIAVIAAVISTAFGLTLSLIKHGHLEPVINTLMYTCVYIFVATETLNTLYRKFKITMLTIITRNHEAVGQAIKTTSTHRTYTLQEGKGGFGGEPFKIVQAIITHEELPYMIDAVEGADADCFYYHHDIEGISSDYYVSPIG